MHSASPRIRLKLRFQRKPFGEVPYYERIGGFNLDGCLSSPMIAVLHRPSIQFFREKALQPDWRYRTWRFQVLRRRYTLPEYMPDPYVAAILIDLAQRQRSRRKKEMYARE